MSGWPATDEGGPEGGGAYPTAQADKATRQMDARRGIDFDKPGIDMSPSS